MPIWNGRFLTHWSQDGERFTGIQGDRTYTGTRIVIEIGEPAATTLSKRTESIIYRSEDIAALDRIVQQSPVPFPFKSETDEIIGSVVKLWRDGNCIKAQVDVSADDVDVVADSTIG